MSSPRHVHDHDECTFLGYMGTEDVYACMQGGDLPTLIVRWGSRPEEYRSGTHLFAELTPELKDAARDWLKADPDVKFILDTLIAAGGEMHLEHLEHRFEERRS
jgi:hypothetical protein